MASYKARAVAIYTLLVRLRRDLESHVDAAPTDKLVLIEFAVEATNKLLYCFALSQPLFDSIDDVLNRHIDVRADPQQIEHLYQRVLSIVRQLESSAGAWVQKYNGVGKCKSTD